jgi:hypothetical protein
VEGQDLKGRPVALEAVSLLAAVLQHEIDHLARQHRSSATLTLIESEGVWREGLMFFFFRCRERSQRCS